MRMNRQGQGMLAMNLDYIPHGPQGRPGELSPAFLIGPRIVLRPYRLADTQAVWEAIDESRASLERWVPDIGGRRTPSDVRTGLESLTHGLGLRRLEAHIPAENTLSVRSAERQGFRIDRSRAPIAAIALRCF
jgi:hypothetical protein